MEFGPRRWGACLADGTKGVRSELRGPKNLVALPNLAPLDTFGPLTKIRDAPAKAAKIASDNIMFLI